MTNGEHTKDWQHLLAAQRRLQAVLPDAVLVGGTAAALHLHHRTSLDGDHVLTDLQAHFDETLQKLEATPGWTTARIQPPVLILGAMDGIPTGVRQLRRKRPLETVAIDGLRTPSLIETARIKAWMLISRNTVRDYLDTVALLEHLAASSMPEFVRSFTACYERGPGGGSVVEELIEKLGTAAPQDLDRVDLTSYRQVLAPWRDLEELRRRGRALGPVIAAIWLQLSEGG
jgi:hypothetical protein